jgi:serine/threonine-protein phosphatase 2A regulatory subunit B'
VINEAVDVKSLKVYVTPQFVQEFLELFDSEESVERDYLKNILHKLYAKVGYSLKISVEKMFMKIYS